MESGTLLSNEKKLYFIDIRKFCGKCSSGVTRMNGQVYLSIYWKANSQNFGGIFLLSHVVQKGPHSVANFLSEGSLGAAGSRLSQPWPVVDV